MAEVNSRQGLLDYCLRRLGYPVIEINVDEDQLNDRLDDALQYFHERHFDGIERVYLKHRLSKEEINTFRTSTTQTSANSLVGISTSNYVEAQNFIPLPDTVIGVNSIFKVDASTISSGLFNIKYQLFLNDLYYYGALDLLNYAMVKTYLEDISRIINPDVQLRFNKKNHRLYIDIDWQQMSDGQFLIIDCYRIVNPADAPAVYNDWWLKTYLTSLIKKQWGQNLTKYNNVQLPGGITLNGDKIYQDGQNEIEKIEYQLKNEYELPPLDMIA